MIRILNEMDIPKVNHLPPKEWNFDYASFLEEYMNEDFFHAFVLVKDDKIVGTGNVFLKNKIAWLANIIIHQDCRSKGLGKKMTSFLVDFLQSKGCETQFLIATKLGEPVYEKVGFVKICEYRCFDTTQDYDHKPSKNIRYVTEEDLNAICNLDQKINGEDRRHLLERYYRTGLGYFTESNELLGIYLPDFGRGLVFAQNDKVGVELLRLKHSKKGVRTMLPIQNATGIQFFENSKFLEGDGVTKMVLGKNLDWHPEMLFSYASGYCG